MGWLFWCGLGGTMFKIYHSAPRAMKHEHHTSRITGEDPGNEVAIPEVTSLLPALPRPSPTTTGPFLELEAHKRLYVFVIRRFHRRARI